MLTEREVLNIFKKVGAYLSGHFLLTSGLHSGAYIQCALVLQHPKYAEKLCKGLASKFKKERPTVVIAPALGGISVSYEVARALGVRSIFTEREAGVMKLRRGFSLNKKDRVVALEDVITTGGSLEEVINIIRDSGAKLVGVGALVDRSGQDLDFGVKFESLLKVDIEKYQPQDCPLCKKGIQVTKPGSREII